MKRIAVAAVALAGVLLAGCSSTSTTMSAPPAGTTQAALQLLERNGLAGMNATEIVETLDASVEDRANGPVGSVRPGELILKDAQGEASLPLPPDKFYLSIAPYLTRTHDCFNHNLASCQGELANQLVHVKIVDSEGTTLVHDDLTTYANGFAGIWLPRDIEATLTVSMDGKTVAAPIGTGDDDPTCLTTLQLR